MDEEKNRPEKTEGFAAHFMAALFETCQHQYGPCTITEVTEGTDDKTA